MDATHSGLQATAAGLILALVFSGSSHGAAADQKVRVIKRSPLVPIIQRLEGDDEVVVVQDFPSVTGAVDEPVSMAREEEYLVDTSDAALVAEVVSTKGRLVDEGLWLRSTITAQVLDVAMERRPGTRVLLRPSELSGELIDMQWVHGGEVLVGSVTVRARPSQLEVGRRYLLFLDEIDGTWNLSVRFEITKDHRLRHILEPDDTRHYAKSPLDGKLLTRVMGDLIREASRRK